MYKTQCTLCLDKVPVSDIVRFYKSTKVCKTCRKDKVPSGKGKQQHIYIMHRNQCVRSLRRGHKEPEYTKEELLKWCEEQETFDVLWRKWKSNNFIRRLAPSINRLKDGEGYSFGNIELVTTQDNNHKAHYDRMSGLDSLTIAINAYKGTTKIGSFVSISEASRQLDLPKSSVAKCLTGDMSSCRGFTFSKV